MKCSVIVLNYNGKELLEEYLPSVVEAAGKSRHDCRVIVLDNASGDDSVPFLKKHFPALQVWIAPQNKVLCSYNSLVEELEDDVVLLLNNDIRLEKGHVDPLLAVFEREKDVFFAASHGNRSIARFHWGVLSPEVGYEGREKLMEERGYSLSAGVAVFDRKKFLELGGYDELYLPGRYEDVDLCYRGWKRGWKGYYEPASRQEHYKNDIGGASFSKAFDHAATQAMVFRNSLLFTVKNMTDPAILLQAFVRRRPRWARQTACHRRSPE